MKQGISMNELFAEVQRQNHAKKDYLIGSDEIYLSNSPNGTTLGFCSDGNPHTFYVNDNAHAQIAQYLDIPKALTMIRCGGKCLIYWLQTSTTGYSVVRLRNECCGHWTIT